MNQHQVILGVVHGEGDLLRRQAHIHRVQHGAYHGYREEALEGAVAVPVQQGHRVPRSNARGGQQVGEAVDALIEGAVVVAQPVCVDDLPARVMAPPGQQQALDQQGISMGSLGWRYDPCLHHTDSFRFVFGRRGAVSPHHLS